MKFGIGKIIVLAVFFCTINLSSMEREIEKQVDLPRFQIKGLGTERVKELVVIHQNKKANYLFLDENGKTYWTSGDIKKLPLGFLPLPDTFDHIASVKALDYKFIATTYDGKLYIDINVDTKTIIVEKLHNHPIKKLIGIDNTIISGSSFPSIKETSYNVSTQAWEPETLVSDGYLLAAGHNVLMYGVPKPVWGEKFYFAIGRRLWTDSTPTLSHEIEVYAKVTMDFEALGSQPIHQKFPIKFSRGKNEEDRNIYNFDEVDIKEYNLPLAAAHKDIAVIFDQDNSANSSPAFKVNTFYFDGHRIEKENAFKIDVTTDYTPSKFYIVNNRLIPIEYRQASYRNADLLCLNRNKVYIIESIRDKKKFTTLFELTIQESRAGRDIVASTLVESEDGDDFTLYVLIQNRIERKTPQRAGEAVKPTTELVIIDKQFVNDTIQKK